MVAVINPGDNSVFLDLMYGTWNEEERQALDIAAKAMDFSPGLSAERIAEIGQYGNGDPGDESDGDRRARARLIRDIAEIERRFGHTIVNRPDWWPKEAA